MSYDRWSYMAAPTNLPSAGSRDEQKRTRGPSVQ